jgi:hypothetical protein
MKIIYNNYLTISKPKLTIITNNPTNFFSKDILLQQLA